jgi:uncharacterized protein YggE
MKELKRIIVCLCFSTAFIFQACDSGNGPVEKNIVKTMLIKSNGEISVQPDEASITVHLACVNMNIKTAKDCLIDRSESLNKSVLELGVKPDDILTTSINQSKEYRWINNSEVFFGYRTSLTTQLTIRDLKILEDLYTGLLLNKNATIGNLSYSHSKMDSLNNAAYLKALENANTLADQLLSKLNETEKEVVRIGNMNLPSVGDNYEVRYEGNMEKELMELNAENRTIRINNGMMYANKTLIVEYRIK